MNTDRTTIPALKRVSRTAAGAAVAITAVAVGAAAVSCSSSRPAVPPSQSPPIAGPFQPSWESLSQYQAPQWFHDAKFGIWAHWTAQCVPEEGDWYAKKMYVQGDPDYEYQVEHYGHPSKVGFKDIDHLWHAEHWDPDKLIALYKRAGAQYFVALANHHDNLDCFDSTYQPWNTVNVGPHKDIVGTWAKAARRAGLRFGVSVHCARTWEWFEVSQGADKTGPLAGVPYDGKLTKADGAGQWWNGLDPQDLYEQNHPLGAPPDPAYIDKFYNRCIDLIDKYHPDLVYFDDEVMPLHEFSPDCGLKIAAHYYNASMQWHDGQNEAVMTTKSLSPAQRKCVVWDVERGVTDVAEPEPFETDTCIGHWHYDRRMLEQHRYKSPATVIHLLADIVSKNGTLLLSVPVRGDGTIDDDEISFLKQMAAWTDINGEAIFATRPWQVYGEGPSTAPIPASAPHGLKDKRNFNEGKITFGPGDVRFTAKGDVVYAILMAWPNGGTAAIKSLGKSAGHFAKPPAKIVMLGDGQPLSFVQSDADLRVTLPAKPPCDHAFVLKITP